jgi:hypothetical protein
MATPSDAPPSPTASFYDMSDDEEGEYNTIRHTKTGRGVKLLYTKSKVCCARHQPQCVEICYNILFIFVTTQRFPQTFSLTFLGSLGSVEYGKDLVI